MFVAAKENNGNGNGKNHPSDTWRMLGKPFNCLYSFSTIQSLIMLISLRFFHNMCMSEEGGRSKIVATMQPTRQTCMYVRVCFEGNSTLCRNLDLLDNITAWKMFQFADIVVVSNKAHIRKRISKMKKFVCENPENEENICINCFSLCLSSSRLHCLCLLNESVPSTRKMLLWWWCHCRCLSATAAWRREWNTAIATITLSTLN